MRNVTAEIMILLTMFAAIASRAQEASDSAFATEADAMQPAVSSDSLSTMASSGNDGGDEQDDASRVIDEIELEASEITGNQELPKMLYIVPWQRAEAGELVGKPDSTALDDALAPIDRTEFIRQVEYYGDLYGEGEE